MRKILLFVLGLLTIAGLVEAQTYDADGAMLSQSRAYVFDGVDAWDRWEGQVLAQQDGAWTVAATQSGVWNIATLTTITNPVAVTGTFFQATQPVSSTQLPAALVGGRFDINLGAIGGTAQSGAQVVDVGNTAFRVNCVIGCGSSSFPDNSAFTFSTSPIANVGFVVDDTATNTVAENSAGAPRMNANRIPYFNLRNNAGTEVPLPSALVAGRFDVNLGSWLGATTPTVGQKAMAASLPVAQSSDYTGALRTVTDTLTGTLLNDAVTIDGLGASSVVVSIGGGMTGAGVLTFECSGDGSTFTSCPAARFIGGTAPVEDFNDTVNPSFGQAFTYKFIHVGFRQYRVRISTAGSGGSSTVVMDASTAGSGTTKRPPYSSGTQPFDLTIPVNTVIISTQGAGMLGVTWSATLGASTVTPTAAGAAIECYSLGDASDKSRTSWTGAVQGIAWVCPLYGAASVTLTKDVGVGAGSSTLSFWVSMSSSVPNESRPVSQWVAGASPTSVLLGAPKLLLDPEGKQAVTLNHPRSFNCAMTSTATTSTVITNCGAPGAGLTRYITGLDWSSSIISTTTNFMTIQYGTGAVCGTGTTVIYRGFTAPAFAMPPIDIGTTPIRLGTNTDLCFLHPGTGTRFINVRGYVAP